MWHAVCFLLMGLFIIMFYFCKLSDLYIKRLKTFVDNKCKFFLIKQSAQYKPCGPFALKLPRFFSYFKARNKKGYFSNKP